MPFLQPYVTPVAALGGYDASASAIFAAMTTPPDATRKAAINAFVVAMKAGGAWACHDSMFIHAAADAQAARVDWITPSRVATLINTPTHTTDRDYTFDGAANGLNSGMIPSSHAVAATGTNLMAWSYERTNLASTSRVLGANNGTNQNMLHEPRSAGGVLLASLNGASTNVATGITDSRGLLGVQRESNDDLTGWQRGVSLGAGVTPSTKASVLPTVAVFIGGYNSAGSITAPRASHLGACGWGGRMTAPQWAAFETALTAYMTTVGANV